jgi:putative NADPH-quinone reductase
MSMTLGMKCRVALWQGPPIPLVRGALRGADQGNGMIGRATYGQDGKRSVRFLRMTNILLIDGHPDPDPGRFVHALADAYAAGTQAGGHAVRRLDLATMEIPILRSRSEWTAAPPPAIAAAQDDIRWAQHLVIFYPLWLGDVPALLKAFLEQVARPGFALAEGTMPKPLLGGRSARLVVTMGMPAFFYRFYFGAHSVKSFERNILKLVGIKPVASSLVGNVEGAADARVQWLETMGEHGAAGN